MNALRTGSTFRVFDKSNLVEDMAPCRGDEA